MKKQDKTPHVLSIVAKCRDLCFAKLIAKDGTVLKDHDGYVPKMMPGEHYGDYIEIEIEIATGKILNWKKPSKKLIDQFIKTGK